MPKKKTKDTQEAQSRRFVETAKALGVDESGKAFEMAIKAVIKKDNKKIKRQSA